MTNDKPITVVPDSPETPGETVVVARFNRKKIAKIAGAATAALGALALFGAAMKTAGRNELLEDILDADENDENEPTES